MSEGTIITFKDEGGLRISKDNTSITTGKVIVNGIEITSVEDWKRVTQSIVELQQENQELKEELQKADSITQSCIFNGKKESEINYRVALNLIEKLRKNNNQLKDRINKAVEYIEKKKLDCDLYGDQTFEIDDLLFLLKGDKE